MQYRFFPSLLLLLFLFVSASSQQTNFKSNFIYTKDDDPILNRWRLKAGCLQSLKADNNNATAAAICECYVNSLDRHFTKQEYRKFSKKGVVDLQQLIDSDPALKKRIDQCYKGSGKTMLIQAQSFSEESINSCIDNIQQSSNKTLDSVKVRSFCSCQFDLIKAKKLTDKEYETITDPNSLLFFEVMYKCGDPFVETVAAARNWNGAAVADINGPAADSVQVLNMNGLTYVKLKLGSLIQFWLFDTGASDLLITKEMEETLKTENILGTENFRGVKEYEMANGLVDSCRTYNVNGVRIGDYFLNNVMIAVSDKAKRIIAGKSLLNKFSSWILDNKNNKLVLIK